VFICSIFIVIASLKGEAIQKEEVIGLLRVNPRNDEKEKVKQKVKKKQSSIARREKNI
jgi:hypothetical protein